jgi:hypothetical protein
MTGFILSPVEINLLFNYFLVSLYCLLGFYLFWCQVHDHYSRSEYFG